MATATIELHRISNITASLEIFRGSEKHFLPATEFAEASMSLILPVKKVSTGQHLELEGRICVNQAQIPFNATGKVISVQEIKNDSSIRVALHLQQFDKITWKRFLDLMDSDQKHLDKLFGTLKGEGA